MAILNLHKPIGISPLNLIDAYKKSHPEFADQKMTYAGRLDPMAEGVVLILTGDDRHKKDEYLKFDKKYRAQILFGIESDTYDLLGLPKILPLPKGELEGVAGIRSKLDVDELIGTRLMRVPPYSSVIVDRKPLFEWARSNELDQISIPEREMAVKNIDFIESSTITSSDLLNLIEDRIKLVKGDFRQDQILDSWKINLNDPKLTFSTITIDLHVASGTYIRSIAHELGKQFGCGALLMSLERSAVGVYTVENSIKL